LVHSTLYTAASKDTTRSAPRRGLRAERLAHAQAVGRAARRRAGGGRRGAAVVPAPRSHVDLAAVLRIKGVAAAAVGLLVQLAVPARSRLLGWRR